MNKHRLAGTWAVLTLISMTLAPLAGADTIVVRPGEMNGWVHATQQGTSSSVPIGAFEVTPGAPLGDGSYHMETFYSDSDPLSKVYIGTNEYSDIPLSSITSLKYWTYVHYRGYDEFDRKGHAPMVEIVTDSGVVGADPKPQQRTFWYRPWGELGSDNDLIQTWQEWDLLAPDGRWELMQTSSGNYFGNWDWVKSRYGDPGTMYLRTPAVGDYLDPLNAELQVGNQTGTSLSIKIGSGKAVEGRYGAWWIEAAGINAFADAVTIGVNGVETTYDFEAGILPTVVLGTRGAQDPIMESAKTLYKFVVFGRVTEVGIDDFTIDDGSGKTLKVVAPGHAVYPNALVSAEGQLDNTTTPPTVYAPVETVQFLEF